MVNTGNKTAKILLTVLAMLANSGWPVVADDGDSRWQTLTSQKEVRRMRVFDDTLCVVTSGGLLSVTDQGQPGEVFTNLNGLGTVDITDIITASDGQKWVTGFGRLVKFGGIDAQQYLFLDNDGDLFRLLCVVDDGETLWVGTEMGLVRFSKVNDGGQIEDSYSLYGDLNPSPSVYDVMLSGDSIWLATSAGLAVSDRSDPNLMKSPSNWTVFGPDEYPELGSGLIQRVVQFESKTYVATGNGLYTLELSPTDTSLAEVPMGQGRAFSEMVVQDDSLFIYYVWGWAVIKDDVVTRLYSPGVPDWPTAGISFGGQRWLVSSEGGLYYAVGEEYAEYPYTGAPGNNVSDIAINAAGVVSAGFNSDGMAQYFDHEWFDIPIDVGSRSTYLTTDSSGNAWVGTFGRGLWLVTDSSEVKYDETNSMLRGNTDPPGGASYVVIHGVATDGRYLYIACYRALNERPLVFADLTNVDEISGWGALGDAEGITTTFVMSIDCANGYVAMGTQSSGIFKCQVGSDPFGCDDGCCIHYTESDWNLISDEIREVKFAPDGLLWAATNSGLAFFDPLASQAGRFVDVDLPEGFGPDVTTVEFDRRGNVWAGSDNGLAFLNAATGEKARFSSVNSGLVSDDVRSLTYDPFTGDLYVGTSSGISILESTTGPPTVVLDSVYAFPNPLVINSGDDQLSFNYALPGTISMYTMAGELVYEMPAGETWDGRNQSGKPVASGIYLFVIIGADQNLGRGKFLLVRER